MTDCSQQYGCAPQNDACETPLANDNPLLLAEELCIGAITRKIEELGVPHSVNYLHRYGWHLTELGLATPDDDLAAASFDQAELTFAALAKRAGPRADRRFRADYDARSLPIFRSRRFGSAAPSENVDTLYLAAGETIATLLPHVEGLVTDLPVHGRHCGVLAELCVAGLLAYGGRLPYPSSDREGNSKTVALNHDHYLLNDGGKLPIEVKYGFGVSSHGYDNAILEIKYKQICQEVAKVRQNGLRGVPLSTIAFRTASALVSDTQISALSAAEHDLLEIMSAATLKKVDDWSAARRAAT